MQGEDGGGGEMRLILTEKAGIHSAGTEQAGKECRSDMRESERVEGGHRGLLAP